MAIFAVMHIFAFPWKPYSIKHSYSDPLSEPGTGYSGGGGTPRYQGGPLGIYALADAFNPWDIIKMTARGFRWLFVGYRYRHDDISYQKPSKLDPEYMGPTFAGSGEAATELQSTKGDGPIRGGYAAVDDRAGLLRHPGQMPRDGPYRTTNSSDYYAAGEDSQVDLGGPQDRNQPPPGTAITSYDFDMKPSEFTDEDTSYHSGFTPSNSAAAGAGAGAGGLSGASVHPAFRVGGQAQYPYPPERSAQSREDPDSIRTQNYQMPDPRSYR